MSSWSGLERVFRLSMGAELGANALALLAALEFKQLIQNGLQDKGIQNGVKDAQIISLSSEEWRASAGIFERKAYDRAKAKLEDLGIVHIQREGRVLRVMLWPNLVREENGVEEELKIEKEPVDQVTVMTTDNSNDKIISTTADRSSMGTCDGTSNRTSKGTIYRTTCGTTRRTSDRTSHRTCFGTPDRTSHTPQRGACFSRSQPQTLDVSGLHHEARPCARSRAYHAYRYSPTPKRYSLKRFSLIRYSLLRYPVNSKLLNFNIYKQRNNVNNEQRNNEQRNNVNPRFNPKGLNLNPVQKIGPEFCRVWQSEMGHALTRYEQEGLERFLRMGFTEELLFEALQQAVLADQHYMGYLLGTLRNWYNEGVRHPRDLPQARQIWEDQRFLQRKRESV